MCVYNQSNRTMTKYKGHTIEYDWYSSKGGFVYGIITIVDGKHGFRTLADAKAYINGNQPKYGIINL